MATGAAAELPSSANLEAQSLAARAQRAATAGRHLEAQDLARKAILLAPGDGRLAADLAPIFVAQPKATPLDPTLLVSWAAAEARSARARAAASAAQGRHADAAEALTVVLRAFRQQGLTADPGLAVLMAELQAEIDAHLRRQRQTDESQNDESRQAQVRTARAAALDQDSLRARRIQERTDRIRELRRLGHRELALTEARRLAKDEPDRTDVRELLALVLAEAHDGRQQTTKEATVDLREELATQMREALLPGRLDGLPDYPEGWLDRRHGTDLRILDQSREAPWVGALRDRLAARMSLKIDRMPLSEALRLVANRAGVNLIIDPTLAAADPQVSLDAPSIRCDNALTWIARQVGSTWTLDQEAVVVGAIAQPAPVLAVYDVANLIHSAQDKPGRELALGAASGTAGAQFVQATPEVRQVTPEDLANLIRTVIRPDSWESESQGITIRGSVLFVMASPEVHGLVKELLRSQEAAQGMMVRVESRWLTVEDAFFERVGVEWTTDGSGVQAGRVKAGAERQWRQGDAVATVRNSLPAATTAYGAKSSTALQLSIAQVGPLQLSAILEAGQRSGQLRSLQAPTITTLNGVRGHAFYGLQRGYIGDYEINAGAMDPQVQVLSTGAILDVKPLISSDRKYVTMDLKPSITSLRLFTEQITASRNYDQVTTNSTGLTTAATYPIELPNITIRSAATTVTVPDRGSVLVGGFGKAIDERMSAGVPYLADIPYLGRLFGTRARGSERSDLYLLTTVTIISYDELETAL